MALVQQAQLCCQHWLLRSSRVAAGRVHGWISALPLYRARRALCPPELLLGLPFTHWQQWAFVLCAKEEMLAINVLINEYTEQILLSVMPFQPHWSWGRLESHQDFFMPASPPEIQRSFGMLRARTKRAKAYIVGHQSGDEKNAPRKDHSRWCKPLLQSTAI